MTQDNDEPQQRSENATDAAAMLEEVANRPWYRVIGYRAPAEVVIYAVIVIALLVTRVRERELGSFAGYVTIGLILLFIALALWDFLDWRSERNAARAALHNQ